MAANDGHEDDKFSVDFRLIMERENEFSRLKFIRAANESIVQSRNKLQRVAESSKNKRQIFENGKVSESECMLSKITEFLDKNVDWLYQLKTKNEVPRIIQLNMRSHTVENMQKMGIASAVDLEFQKRSGIILHDDDYELYRPVPKKNGRIILSDEKKEEIKNSNIRQMGYGFILATKLSLEMDKEECPNFMKCVHSVFQHVLVYFVSGQCREAFENCTNEKTAKKFIAEIKQIAEKMRNPNPNCYIYAQTRSIETELARRLMNMEQALTKDAEEWMFVRTEQIKYEEIVEDLKVNIRPFEMKYTSLCSLINGNGFTILKFPKTVPAYNVYLFMRLFSGKDRYFMVIDGSGQTCLACPTQTLYKIKLYSLCNMLRLKNKRQKEYPIFHLYAYFYYRAIVDYRSTFPTLAVTEMSAITMHSFMTALASQICGDVKALERVSSTTDLWFEVYYRFHFVIARYKTNESIMKPEFLDAIMSFIYISEAHTITKEAVLMLRELYVFNGAYMKQAYPYITLFLEECENAVGEQFTLEIKSQSEVFDRVYFQGMKKFSKRERNILLASNLFDLCASTNDIELDSCAQFIFENIKLVTSTNINTASINNIFPCIDNFDLLLQSCIGKPQTEKTLPIRLSTKRSMSEKSEDSKLHCFGILTRVLAFIEWRSTLKLENRQNEQILMRGIIKVKDNCIPSWELRFGNEHTLFDEGIYIPTNNIISESQIKTLDSYHSQQLQHNENVLLNYVVYSFNQKVIEIRKTGPPKYDIFENMDLPPPEPVGPIQIVQNNPGINRDKIKKIQEQAQVERKGKVKGNLSFQQSIEELEPTKNIVFDANFLQSIFKDME